MNPTTDPPRCFCGCGASMQGWSSAGRYLRTGVRRVYDVKHRPCHYCGQPTDQYGECQECGGE